MRYKIQMLMETETGESLQEIACLEREMPEIPGIESVGLTLAEAKALLLGIQQALVGRQCRITWNGTELPGLRQGATVQGRPHFAISNAVRQP